MKAYLNQDADKRIFDVLCAMGFEVIPLAPFGALASPVSSHADMLLCSVDDKIFIPQNYEIKINDKKNSPVSILYTPLLEKIKDDVSLLTKADDYNMKEIVENYEKIQQEMTNFKQKIL